MVSIKNDGRCKHIFRNGGHNGLCTPDACRKASGTYDRMVSLAEQEQNDHARPAIKNRISNLSQYDTIYVGYPIWFSDMPQIMYTFFDTYTC